MIFGKVPFSILFIEGAIVYVTMLLMERIHVPTWVLPFGAGLLSLDYISIQLTFGQFKFENFQNSNFSYEKIYRCLTGA